MPTLADLARRTCLQNAVQHGAKCEPKGLVGRILGGHPEHRGDPAAVMAALTEAAAVVNAMSIEEQKAAIETEAPALLNAPKKERRTGLKELPNAVKGKVVMRFAPNPNGPLSLGHSRGVSILAEYQRMYDATMILRFDDTDPSRVRGDARADSDLDLYGNRLGPLRQVIEREGVAVFGPT